jgi:alpha-amylase
MSNICLAFLAHQPNRLIHYDFFQIGEHAFYEDDDLNARVLSAVAQPIV